MSIQVSNTRNIFYGKDGMPLNGGYIYIGQSNQNPEISPIAVYWDALMTQPASQPIRTINGYPSRQGVAAKLYVNSFFSITVKDKNKELVLYDQKIAADIDSSALLFYPDLLSAQNAASTLQDGQQVQVDVSGIVYQYTVLSGVLTSPKRIGGSILVSNYTATSASVADGIQAAILAAYESKASMLLFDGDSVLNIDKAIFFNSYGVLTRDLVVLGLKVKLTAQTAGGAAVNIGRGADVGNGSAIERTGKLTFINPQIDGNNIAGENGFGISRAEDVLILNPSIRNCQRDYVGTREGGRGITTHSRCKNIHIVGYHAYRCSDAIHHAPAPDYTSSAVKITSITGITKGATTTFTVASNTFVVGDVVYTYGVGGMTQINPTYGFTPAFTVTAVAGNTVTVNLDSSGYTDYTSGGTILLADLTDEGRSPGVSYSGVYAEECEYTLVNVETANYPRTLNPMPTLFITGITAKNCGTTPTRGLISGSQASVQIDGIAAYNDASHPIQSIVRGAFQFSRINGVFDIHTMQRAVDADPTSENPSGTGIDAGIGTHPFGTSCDNDYNILILYRGNQASITSLINATDISGSVDRFYRNKISIVFSGQVDGINYTRPLSNIALHYTNQFHITDRWSAREYIGGITTASASLPTANSTRYFSGNIAMQEFAKVIENSSGNASYVTLDSSGALSAGLRFQGANNRWYVGIRGTDYWQLTQNNILPNADNVYDAGSPGLRLRTVYAGTGSINTSDGREKSPPLSITDDVLDAWGDVQLVMYQWLESIVRKNGEEFARWHFGVIAQSVRDAFIAHGLDGTRYGLLCHDEWGDVFEPVLATRFNEETHQEELYETGEQRLLLEAGDRWGIRPDQCLFLEAAFQRRRSERIEKRLDALEARA